MATDKIRLATEGTGPYTATYSRTEDAVTKHFQRVVSQSARVRTGLYRVDSGVLSLAAAADAATAGKLWLINPAGSSVAVALKTLAINLSASAATAMPTAPRITIERVTFTGTATGATVTPAKRVRTAVAGATADATAVGSIRTASTGLTLTAGEMVRAVLVPAMLTAVGSYGGPYVWDPDEEDEELLLAAGEGLVIRQADAGTTGEVRRFTTSLVWEEFTAP